MATKDLNKGYFLTLEGIDNAGKSSHCDFIAKLFERHGRREVIITREPGGSPAGEAIRKILLEGEQSIHKDTELLLFFAARSQHYNELIKPALAAGKVVISDRFTDSSYAYQGSEGLEIEQGSKISLLQKLVLDDFQPDCTLLFDLAPEHSIKRSYSEQQRFNSFDKRHSETEDSTDFLEKVRLRYLKLAESAPDRIKIITAKNSISEVRVQIQKIISEAIS